MSSMLKVWGDTYGFANQYICTLAIHFMNILSSLYGIIMDCAINEPGHVKNVVEGINTMGMWYLKEEIDLIGKLTSYDISKIGMLPSASKYISKHL